MRNMGSIKKISKDKSVIILGIILIVVNILSFYAIFSYKNESSVYFLNVGQGDAELISHEGVNILIDAGRDVTTSVELEKIFNAKKYIDIIILSHQDSDHVGGLFQILDRFSVGVILLGNGLGENWEEVMSYANRNNISFYKVDTGDVVKYRDLLLTVLWPDEFYSTKEDNEISSVIKYENSAFSVLFTGDILEKIEKILPKLFDLNSDILKVSHHGSKFSSSVSFLNYVTPFFSIIEVGKNSYGHPTNEVLDRLNAVGSMIFRTDEKGTIKVYEKNGFLNAEQIF